MENGGIGVTSAALQWLALVAMLIDHLGYLFFPGIPLLRAVGRLSFPIFAFLLAEGLAYTANVKRYALRLWAFAVFSEVPYQLFTYGRLAVLPWHNVMFELLLMLAAAWLAQRGGWGFLGAAGIAVAASAGGFMYGAYGVALAVCFTFTRKKPWLRAACLAACTAAYCFSRGSLFQVWAILAAAPLLLYNGQRGRRGPRYFFYGFYPAHLLLLALAKLWLAA